MATNNRVYKVLYFTQFGNVIAKNYKTQAEAETFYTSLANKTPWRVILNCLDSDTVTDVTPAP